MSFTVQEKSKPVTAVLYVAALVVVFLLMGIILLKLILGPGPMLSPGARAIVNEAMSSATAPKVVISATEANRRNEKGTWDGVYCRLEGTFTSNKISCRPVTNVSEGLTIRVDEYGN